MSDSADVQGVRGASKHGHSKLRTDEAQERKDLEVDVTVLRAQDLPELKTWRGRNRRIYATVSGDTGKKENEKATKAVRCSGNTVVWKEELDVISVRPSSQISLSLYAEHLIHDIHIGTIKIDPISTTETSFTLRSSHIPDPVIFVTLHVHRNPADRTIPFPKPSIEQDTSTLFIPTEGDFDENMIEDVRGALNEVDSAMRELKLCKKWEETVQNIHWVMCTVKDIADLHPFAKAAWGIISAVPEALLTQFERDDNISFLVETMHSVYNLVQAEELLKTIKPNSNLALILKVMLKHINVCSEVIQRYAIDEQFSKRLLTNITGKINDDVKDLCDTLQRLRRDLVDNAIINMQIANHFMQKSMSILTNDVSNMTFDACINELPYRSGWSSTANKSGCIEGTRADFLEYILEWIKNPLSERGLILFGKAGTGKSSIAFEIASRFCFEEHPASYFSFSRAQKSKQKDHHLFTTIIRDISDHHPVFKLALGGLIANNSPLRQTDDFSQLFNILLLTPLEKIGPTKKPELIVIDALDESGDPKKLAIFLSQSLFRLPSNFRILITSRSESDIENCFSITHGTSVSSYETLQMDDPKLAAKVQEDIRLYFQRYLTTDLFKEYGGELVTKAEGLFQWAAVACGYINEPPAGYTDNDCLRGLLGREADDKPYTQELQSTKLYKLYDEVLSGYFTSNITRPRFRSVVAQLLAAFEPVSVNTLTSLRRFMPGDARNRDPQSVLAVVKFMGSLLSNVTSTNRNLPIVPFHTSFRDFLTDETGKHPFSLDLAAAHKELTCACLDLMLAPDGLRFNIVKLESSHLPNNKVEDLQLRIDNFISPSLFYATRFWDDHLESTFFDKIILDKLEQFFATKFLFWLEVLSVTETVPLAVQAITLLVQWLQPGLNAAEPEVVNRIRTFLGIVNDAHTFLRCFGKIIATSAPHIYVSALPFAPTSSHIYRTYSSQFPPTLIFKQGQLAHWPALEMSIPAPCLVKCVAFSPDSQWIAAGLQDGTIRLWNATTGRLEGKPFRGHTGQVRTVEFSPNGLHIISGAYDCTIRMWNVATGTIAGEPWRGHQYPVNSVAFAPNGRRAVSGSGDTTIRLWDVAKGAMVGLPLAGHTGKVRSVAFSPDGKRIVSGSSDYTIRVWKLDVENGALEESPLILRASSEVRSVGFSPNGQQIVSGGFERTIHIWDNLTGPHTRVGATRLIGHAYSVNSVKYSPDGLQIVSGSGDGKICLWNTSTKRVDGSPFIGHTQSVRTVAFSPDGQRIVSAADDNMIHVWDATSAKRVVNGGAVPVTGHIGTVNCVAVSPVRGNLIASGADDHTICLWNVDTEKIAGPPLVGHTANIHSVKFSPDGRQLASASADRTVRLWNVEQGTVEGAPLTGHTNDVRALAFSPDGRRIVSGSSDLTLRVWNAETGALESGPLIGHSGSVTSVEFSPDGRHIVSGASDGTLRIWDIDSRGACSEGIPLIGHGAQVRFAAFFPGGDRIISCARDHTVCVWDVATRKVGEGPAFALRPDVPGDLAAFAWLPVGADSDGTTTMALIAAGFADSTIGVWDLATQEPMELCGSGSGTLRGHTGFVSGLAFWPGDGQRARRLVSGSVDSTVRVWDLASSKAASASSTLSNADVDSEAADELRVEMDMAAIDGEGWVCGRAGELVVWIPHHQRPTLQRPKHTVAVFAAHQIRLDFSSFSHGRDWGRHYKRDCL